MWLSLVWCPGQKKRKAPLPFFHGSWEKATKRLTALPPEIDCDQTAMGLPPVTSPIFHIAKAKIKFTKKCGCLGGISEISLLPFYG
jgi:hypothetical protein